MILSGFWQFCVGSLSWRDIILAIYVDESRFSRWTALDHLISSNRAGDTLFVEICYPISDKIYL